MTTKLLLHLNGDATDSSGASTPTSTIGSVSYVSGKFNQGLSVQESLGSGVISIPMTNDLRSIGSGDSTVEFFIKIPQGHGGFVPITIAGYSLQIGYPYDNQFRRFAIRSGESLTQTNTTWQYDSTGTMIDNGAFQHIALVKKNGLLSLYVEGQRKFWSNFETEVAISDFGTNAEFILGGYKQNGVYYTNGNGIIIDEFRVSNEAIYTTNFTAPSNEFSGASSQGEVMAKLPHLIKKKAIENGAVDGDIIKLLNGQAIKILDGSGTSQDLIKVVSGNVHVLGSQVELKSASDANLQTAKDYADAAVASLVNSAPALLDTLKELSDAIGGDANFAATVASQIGAVDDKVDTEITNRIADVDAEEQARISDVADLQSQIDGLSELLGASGGTSIASQLSSLDSRLDVIEGIGAGSISKAQSDAQDYADAAVAVEQSRAEGVEAGFDSRLDVIEGVGAGSISKAQSDAQDYADAAVLVEKNRAEGVEADLQSQISNILSNSDATALNSLAEIVAEFQSVDGDLLSAINSLSTSSTSAISAEQSRAEAEEATLFKTDGSRAATGAFNMGSHKITSVTDPSPASQDAATAAYVDANGGLQIGQAADGSAKTISTKKIAFSSGTTATNAILPSLSTLMVGSVIVVVNGANATITVRNSGNTANVGQVPPYHYAFATLTDKSGAGTWALHVLPFKTGSGYSFAGANLINVATPVNSTDGANKSYVDAEQTRATAAEGVLTTNLSSEISRATAAEDALDARVDVLEAKAFGKENLVVPSSVPSYFDLAHLAQTNSIMVYIGASPIHEGASDGYTVSTVSGVSRITFNATIEENDKVFFYYRY